MTVTFAVAYLLCVLAPPIALAFVDNAAAPRCVTARHQHTVAVVLPNAKPQVHTATAHVHSDQSPHLDSLDHAAPGENQPVDNDLTGTCCGYFCLSALPASETPGALRLAQVIPVTASIDRGIPGRGPGRIDRPPIVVLPH